MNSLVCVHKFTIRRSLSRHEDVRGYCQIQLSDRRDDRIGEYEETHYDLNGKTHIKWDRI